MISAHKDHFIFVDLRRTLKFSLTQSLCCWNLFLREINKLRVMQTFAQDTEKEKFYQPSKEAAALN
jgi:hypothetical protein